MPVTSKAQLAYLGIHHPEVLRKMKREGYDTSARGLPQYAHGKPKKSKKRRKKNRRTREYLGGAIALLEFSEWARGHGKKRLAGEARTAADVLLRDIGW